eukprot:s289_g5.t1
MVGIVGLRIHCWQLVLMHATGGIMLAEQPLLASESGQFEVANLLLEAGADKDCRDEAGRTALMLAFQSGHSEVARLLWSARLKQVLHVGNAGEVHALAVHPSSEMQLFATGSSDATIRFWDARDHSPVGRVLDYTRDQYWWPDGPVPKDGKLGHSNSGGITQLQVSSDRAFVMSNAKDGQVLFFDIRTGERALVLPGRTGVWAANRHFCAPDVKCCTSLRSLTALAAAGEVPNTGTAAAALSKELLVFGDTSHSVQLYSYPALEGQGPAGPDNHSSLRRATTAAAEGTGVSTEAADSRTRRRGANCWLFAPTVCQGTYGAPAYRKVPGNKCQGGWSPPTIEVPCPSGVGWRNLLKWALLLLFVFGACHVGQRSFGSGGGKAGFGEYRAGFRFSFAWLGSQLLLAAAGLCACIGRLMSRTPRDYEKLKDMAGGWILEMSGSGEDEWDFDGVGRESLNDFLDEADDDDHPPPSYYGALDKKLGEPVEREEPKIVTGAASRAARDQPVPRLAAPPTTGGGPQTFDMASTDEDLL